MLLYHIISLRDEHDHAIVEQSFSYLFYFFYSQILFFESGQNKRTVSTHALFVSSAKTKLKQSEVYKRS